MKHAILFFFMLTVSTAFATTQSPYAGNQSNEIKSLTPEEIDGLERGAGMGFAKAAELNQFPGPRHVLDLADQLNLSDHQISQTHEVFAKMRARAIALGLQIIEKEKELDELFSSGAVSTSSMDALLLTIGETKARLRGTHLHAHLEMKAILNRHQVMMYDKLRGYADGHSAHKHNH